MTYGRKGFTLIELIIVIVIIGILASIAAPMMRGIQAKAIITEGLAGISAVWTSQLQYYATYGDYPPYGFSAVSANSGTAFFPGLSLRYVASPYGSSATDGKRPSLDGHYFSQDSYGCNKLGDGTISIFCYRPSSNPGPGAARAMATTDADTAFIRFYTKTRKYKQLNWSKSGYAPDNGSPD